MYRPKTKDKIYFPTFILSQNLSKSMKEHGKLFVTQLLSWVQLFAAPWTAAHQASLFFPISQNLVKFMFIESVMPSNHLILCHPLLFMPSIFPRIKVFSKSQLFASDGQSIRASASALPMNIQGCFPLALAGLMSLMSKGFSRAFSSITIQNNQSIGTQPSLWSNSQIHT